MLFRLDEKQFERVRELFAPMDFHLAVAGILDGSVPGEVYVDDVTEPASALARAGRRFFVSGAAQNPAFNAGLRRLFLGQVYPQALASGDEAFNLFFASEDWAEDVEEILRGKFPMKLRREYYEYRASGGSSRRPLPAGIEIRPVDAPLLEQTGLINLERLKQEMVSECPSLQAFLESKFGVCAVKGTEIAGWCLSEYNRKGCCEVGIETVEPYQKQGIGTNLTHALVERARAAGIKRIGWHCYASNVASSATARAAGFAKVRNYDAFLALFDEAANLAVNGNACFREKRYAEAVAWYERALRTGRAPAWAAENLEKAKRFGIL